MNSDGIARAARRWPPPGNRGLSRPLRIALLLVMVALLAVLRRGAEGPDLAEHARYSERLHRLALLNARLDLHASHRAAGMSGSGALLEADLAGLEALQSDLARPPAFLAAADRIHVQQRLEAYLDSFHEQEGLVRSMQGTADQRDKARARLAARPLPPDPPGVSEPGSTTGVTQSPAFLSALHAYASLSTDPSAGLETSITALRAATQRLVTAGAPPARLEALAELEELLETRAQLARDLASLSSLDSARRIDALTDAYSAGFGNRLEVAVRYWYGFGGLSVLALGLLALVRVRPGGSSGHPALVEGTESPPGPARASMPSSIQSVTLPSSPATPSTPAASSPERAATPATEDLRRVVEERLSMLCTLALDPVLILDLESRILEFNPAAEQLFGRSRAEVLGADAIAWFVPAELRDAYRERLSACEPEAERSSRRVTSEIQALQADGEAFPAELRIARSNAGTQPVWVAWVRDIRGRQRLRDLEQTVRTSTQQLARSTLDLKISEARKAAILKAAIDCIISIDGRGAVLEFNPAAERELGLEPPQGERRIFELIRLPPALRAARSAEGGDGFVQGWVPLGEPIQVAAVRRDGTEFPAELTVVRIDVDGPEIFTAYLRDLTERERVDRLKNEFISILSHELRTPLTSIRGSLGLLESGVMGALSDEVLELVQIARTNGDRLIRLVNEMLDVDKLEAGKIELHVTPLAPGDLLRAACDSVVGLAIAGEVSLEMETEPLLHMQGDRDRLIQVLSNLLSNAIKFSPPGASVSARARRVSADRVRFEIEDRGPGIPADKVPMLFSKFHQLDASDARTRGGTGLGLVISKGLVELHGGRIGVESTPGRGSTFYFELPLPGGLSA